MSMSRRSPGYYGARVEEWVLGRYQLERDYSEVDEAHMDAVDPDGRPVEIKAVARNREGGRATGVRFKIWRDQHKALKNHNGSYVFVLYCLRSDGITVLNSRSVRASNISVRWYGKTKPRGEEQAEIRAREIF